MNNVQDNATSLAAFDDVDDAADAILERWSDAEKPSETEELTATDEASQEETEEAPTEINDDDENDQDSEDGSEEDPDETDDPDTDDDEEEDDEDEKRLQIIIIN